jgi:ethanolamine utilization microcompartment shell protein EutS
MPEPVTLSIIASTIAVVTLAYKSTKTLVEFIDCLRGAPKLIKDVKGDVEAVQHILKSFELLLEPRSGTMPRRTSKTA